MPGGQPNNQPKQLQDAIAKSKKDANKEIWAKNRQGDGTSKDREKAPGYKTPGYVPTGNPRGRPKKTE